MLRIRKRHFLCVQYFVFFICLSKLTYGQIESRSYGNLFVKEGTEYWIEGQHIFKEGNYGKKPSIIGTSRVGPVPGLVSFKGEYSGEGLGIFVDGYVKSYVEGAFIFPVGDGSIFKPVLLSDSKDAIVSYYFADPNIGITDYYDNSISTIALPSGAPFISSVIENSLGISTSEYWDIRSSNPQKITLQWDISSNIRDYIRSFNELSIFGWKDDNWVMINSEIDVKNVFDGSDRSYNSGSITTVTDIVPSDYEVFTLGKRKTVDLEVKYFVNKEISFPQDFINFYTTVKNNGDTDATNIKIVAPLRKADFVNTNKEDYYEPVSGTWLLERLPVDAIDTLRVTVRIQDLIEEGTEIINKITDISQIEIDSELSDDIKSFIITIASPGLGVVFNAITIDGDNINEKLLLTVEEGFSLDKGIEVFIYNDQGVLVYYNEDYRQNDDFFDGYANQGVLANRKLREGNYFYDLNDGEKTKSGYIYVKY